MTLLGRRGIQILGVLIFAPILILVFKEPDNQENAISEPGPLYIADLLTTNDNLQINKFQKVGNGVWVYSAYLDDDCPKGGTDSTCVTILALSEYNLKAKDWDCHLMESGLVSVAGTGQEREHGRSSRQGNASVHHYQLYSDTLWKISCSGEVPETVDAVKLIRDQDEVIVRVVNTAKKKKGKQVLGVCLAGVLWSSGGSEGANDLISFFEFYREAGAKGVIMYALPQTREVAIVLDYYISLGFVEVVEWDIPSDLLKSSSLVYLGQNILLQDCLHRSRNQYEYVVYSDLDERVLPTRPNTSLIELIEEVDDSGTSSFAVLVTFYLSIWKASMERLRVLYKGRERIPNIREATFTQREKRPGWEYKTRSRYIVKPSFVHEVDIHNVVRSVPGFKTMELSRDHVALAHFRLQGARESFPGLAEEQEEDLNLVRGWTPNLLDRVSKVCKLLETNTENFHCSYIGLNVKDLMANNTPTMDWDR